MSNYTDLFASFDDLSHYDESLFNSAGSSPLSAHSSTLDDLAQKAFNGDYGPSPFEAGTEGNKALLHDAYEKVGAHVPEDYWLSFDGTDGGVIMQNIQTRCDWLAEKADTDTGLDFSAASFAMEKEDADANAHPAELQSRDSTVLESENPQILVDAIVASNEGRIERGEDPIKLQPETIAELEKRGVDVSGLAGTEATDPQDVSATRNGESAASNDSMPLISQPANDNLSSDHRVGGVTQEAGGTDVSGNVENNDVMRFVDSATGENSLVTIECGENDAPKDIILIDENGNETRLSDIIAAVASSDSRLEDIFGHALEMADHGEDWKEYLQTSLTEYVDELKAPPSVTIEDTIPANDTSGDDQEQKYQDRFEYHKGVESDRNNAVVPFRRDTFTAYHTMAKVFNAYRGGIEVDGKTPNIADVITSISNFVNSNVFETLIVSAIRTIVEKPERNDVEQESPRGNVEQPATDSFGIQESGRIDARVDEQAAKDISAYRKDLPEAAMSFGADMTKVDRGSRDDITIRTTNAQNAGGRGVSITLDSAKRFTMPDLRLVDFKGERILVDPFGKVLDVVSGEGKFKVGQTLSGLDVSSSENGKVALETYARDNGISVEQAKVEISATCQERFCDRIEDTYRVEARTIERTVIPREQEMKADIESKIANLGRMEQMATSPDDKAAIGQKRMDLQEAKTTIEDRITALRDRVDQLHGLADKGAARSISDRFSDAVASEKGAVGRSVKTVDFGVDMKAIGQDVRVGVEEIKARIEVYNADKPEMDRLSYDSKTGDFVDRFGINDKGEYVGNENGKFMAEGISGPESPEQVQEYIKEHYDPSRFDDIEKILTAEVDRPERFDVESDQNRADPVEARGDNDTEKGQNDPIERTGENDDTEKGQNNADAVERAGENDDTEKGQNKADPIEQPGDGSNIETGQGNNSVEHSGEGKDTETGQQNGDPVEQAIEGNDTEAAQGNENLVEQPGGDNIETGQGGIGGDDIEALGDDEETTSKSVTSENKGQEVGEDDLEGAFVENSEGSSGDGSVADGNEGGVDANNASVAESDTATDDALEGSGGNVSSETTAEGIDTIAETVKTIDIIDDPTAANVAVGPEGGANEAAGDPATAKATVEAEGPTSDPISSANKDISKWADGLSQALADLGVSPNQEALADFITGHSDSLAEIVNNIESADDKASAISDIANFVLDVFHSWIDSIDPAAADGCVEVGSKFMEGMLGSLGMENAVNVSNAIYDAQENIAYEAHHDQIDQMTDGLANGLEPYKAEYYELDDFMIGQAGTTDGYTGEEVGGFQSEAAADQFVNDVGKDVQADLTQVDFVEVPNEGVEVEQPDNVEKQGVDNDDDDFKPDMEVFENGNADQGIDGLESAGEVEGIEAAAAAL